MEHFIIAKYRFYIRAGKEGLDLPAFKGSTLRGVLGNSMRRIVCLQKLDNCSACPMNRTCPYYYIFETSPVNPEAMMKGYHNIPRPYVIEPPAMNKDRIEPFEEISFNLLLYGQAVTYFPYFLLAFEDGGQLGVGKRRKKYYLEKVDAVNDLNEELMLVYDPVNKRIKAGDFSWTGSDILEFTKKLTNIKRVKIIFSTPTLLKINRSFLSRIEDLSFEFFIRSIFRRFSSLYAHHHNKVTSADYGILIKKANRIEVFNSEGHNQSWERISLRRKEKNTISGFVGNVIFTGDLEPFIPYIFLGQWMHVGKWVTYGMGKYTCELGVR